MPTQPFIDLPNSSGIFKASSSTVTAIEEAAKSQGADFFRVNLSSATNVPGFIRALRRDLHIPADTPKHLSALHDALTEFSWSTNTRQIVCVEHTELLSITPTSLAAFNALISSVVDSRKNGDRILQVFYIEADPHTMTHH